MDIGATLIKYGIWDERRTVIHEGISSTASHFKELVTQILGIINEAEEKFNINACGIGMAGFISSKDKKIAKSPNMPFLNGINLTKEVGEKTTIPIFIENDGNLNALGEYYLLEEPRPNSLINITLGTGLGGGIILEGKIWNGQGGFGGELGHVIVNPEGRLCGCGSRGCVETESTETGILSNYKEQTGKEMQSSLEIFNLYSKGDKQAIQSFNRAGYYLGIFLTTLINVFNPTIISIGGGVSSAGEAIMKPALKELRLRINQFFLESTEIKISNHGIHAGIFGAVHYASYQLANS